MNKISRKDILNVKKVQSLDKKLSKELQTFKDELNSISIFVGQIHEKNDLSNIEDKLKKIDKLTKHTIRKFKKLKRKSITLEDIKRKIYDDLYTRYTPEQIKNI